MSDKMYNPTFFFRLYPKWNKQMSTFKQKQIRHERSKSNRMQNETLKEPYEPTFIGINQPNNFENVSLDNIHPISKKSTENKQIESTENKQIESVIDKNWYSALQYYSNTSFVHAVIGWQLMKILHLCPFTHCGRVDMSNTDKARKKMYRIAQQVCKFYINII